MFEIVVVFKLSERIRTFSLDKFLWATLVFPTLKLVCLGGVWARSRPRLEADTTLELNVQVSEPDLHVTD